MDVTSTCGDGSFELLQQLRHAGHHVALDVRTGLAQCLPVIDLSDDGSTLVANGVRCLVEVAPLGGVVQLVVGSLGEGFGAAQVSNTLRCAGRHGRLA